MIWDPKNLYRDRTPPPPRNIRPQKPAAPSIDPALHAKYDQVFPTSVQERLAELRRLLDQRSS